MIFSTRKAKMTSRSRSNDISIRDTFSCHFGCFFDSQNDDFSVKTGKWFCLLTFSFHGKIVNTRKQNNLLNSNSVGRRGEYLYLRPRMQAVILVVVTLFQRIDTLDIPPGVRRHFRICSKQSTRINLKVGKNKILMQHHYYLKMQHNPEAKL